MIGDLQLWGIVLSYMGISHTHLFVSAARYLRGKVWCASSGE
jgi:hypothetical protein